MASVGVGYDLGCNTYSPAGRVFQVEYASKAVENSGTVVGIRCNDGIVMGVEKLIHSKMLVSSSYHRIFTMSKNTGIAIGGVIADGRRIVNRGREECKGYIKNFGIEMPGKVLASRISSFIHIFTQYWHLRPMGTSCLLGVYDETDGPQLYMLDPSGECHRYYGIAVGKGQQQARVELEKIDFKNMKCKEAVTKIAEIIYSVHDEVKDKPFELEMSWICDESKRLHVMLPQDILDAAKAAGIKAQEDDDSEEEDDDQ